MTRKKTSTDGPLETTATGDVVKPTVTSNIGNTFMVYGAPPPPDQLADEYISPEQELAGTERLKEQLRELAGEAAAKRAQDTARRLEAITDRSAEDAIDIVQSNLHFSRGVLAGLQQRPNVGPIPELANALTKLDEAQRWIERSRHRLK